MLGSDSLTLLFGTCCWLDSSKFRLRICPSLPSSAAGTLDQFEAFSGSNFKPGTSIDGDTVVFIIEALEEEKKPAKTDSTTTAPSTATKDGNGEESSQISSPSTVSTLEPSSSTIPSTENVQTDTTRSIPPTNETDPNNNNTNPTTTSDSAVPTQEVNPTGGINNNNNNNNNEGEEKVKEEKKSGSAESATTPPTDPYVVKNWTGQIYVTILGTLNWHLELQTTIGKDVYISE